MQREGNTAFAQKRSGWYRVVFNYGGKKYRKGLKTTNAAVADAVVGGIKRTILMLGQGFLQIPEGADVLTFILSGGKTVQSFLMPPAPAEPTPEPVTLDRLRESMRSVANGINGGLTMESLHFTYDYDASPIGAQYDDVAPRRVTAPTEDRYEDVVVQCNSDTNFGPV